MQLESKESSDREEDQCVKRAGLAKVEASYYQMPMLVWSLVPPNGSEFEMGVSPVSICLVQEVVEKALLG